MSRSQKFLRALTTIVTGALLLGVAVLASRGASASSIPVASPRLQSGFIAHTIKLHPVFKKLGKVQDVRLKQAHVNSNGTVLFQCQSNTNPIPLLCYGPDQIRQAYGVRQLQQDHRTGQGSSIVIIDAFGSPTIQTDLQAFDAAWGLPDPTLNVLTPFGVNGSDPGWAGETSLDVEWSHVMAPGAAITLVIASTSSDVDIYNAIKYAVDHNLGDVISMSFGENESCVDPQLLAAEHQVFSAAAQKHITLLASAGDFGSAQFTCDGSSFTEAVSYPASDPLVTALGGTALTADATTGDYTGETAWNESAVFNAATGGGYSLLFQRPKYQSGVTGDTPGRAVPDLSLNASIDGGVLVYETDLFSGQLFVSIFGGTSVATPEFAGLLADGIQQAHHRLGFLNVSLYRIGSSDDDSRLFNDITSGTNILFSSGIPGFTVQHKWDAVTGWGTPKHAGDFLTALIRSLHPDDVNNA